MATRKCCECGEEYKIGSMEGNSNVSKYLPTRSFLFDGFLPVCNYCIEARVRKIYENNEDDYWNFLDQLCQMLDIKFDPSLWEKLYKTHKYKTFIVYANMMRELDYKSVNWSDCNRRYLELQKEELLDDEIPELRAQKIAKMQEKWGPYCEEDLAYLENLLTGIMKSQDVNGAKSYDEAKKLCKVSLLIEQRIRAGEDFDKMLGSYEKLTKIADFTPKNAKNINDFDSVGELFAWLERKGWQNPFYDGVTKDIVDSTMKNMQSYVRNLYVNETSISDEIERRLEALKHIQELENPYYDEDKLDDPDAYEQEGYLVEEEFMEEF